MLIIVVPSISGFCESCLRREAGMSFWRADGLVASFVSVTVLPVLRRCMWALLDGFATGGEVRRVCIGWRCSASVLREVKHLQRAGR